MVPVALRTADTGMRHPGEDTRLASARAMLTAGKPDKAESLVKRMLHYQPDHAGALHLAGQIARARGRLVRAVQLLEKAAAARPDAADIWCDYGLALKAAGRHDEAVAAQRCVAGMLPASPLALANLGAACIAAGLTAEALSHLARADALAPGNAEILYNLGNAQLRAGDWPAAEAAFSRALDVEPLHAGAKTNLASVYKEQGRLEDALALLRVARAMHPDNADAEWNLALSLLTAGAWKEGWAHYEARRRIPGFALRHLRPAPWDGSPLDGRRLLVHAEQGMGDAIQFCRYLKHAAACGGEVAFLVHDRLAPLLSTLDVDIRVLEAGGKTPRYDVEAPLMSLPHLLRRPDAGADRSPYLKADPARVGRWRQVLPADGRITVAIAWQGCPDYAADTRRSIPLARFGPLAALDGVRLVSLQKGGGAEQLGLQGWAGRVAAPDETLDADGAFLDSAAILRNADLLVTSDTAMAHLGGALGVETWLALAHVPDWRWGRDGETTPWYSGMRLFRQRSPGDWDGVFAAIAAELRKRLP
ncbi:MAG: tetratricopeptide repeat protein [Alphaproteobacteria bacterium]|nr:tetratricopeptide repeat protein [Alphaproteobacteria bacterium]